jgi:hypothetical protein
LFSCLSTLPAYAYNNDYGSSPAYDSYSQSWQSYKQQNNINTQPTYQQTWWNSAVNSIGNFFSGVTQAVTNFVTNVGNFFNNIVTSVQNFFVKTPDIKANQATAPPDLASIQSSGVINHAPTLDSSRSLSVPSQDGTYRNERTDTATKTKDNPYAYLTAEKACYDPRAAGLPEMSDAYQAIVKEYAARDQWVAQRKVQSVDVGAIGQSPVALDASSAVPAIDQPVAIPKNTINQDTVKTITPLQVTPAQPDIIPVGSREVLSAAPSTVKNTLITVESHDNIQYILDKEVTGIDRNTALTNIKTAFAGHNDLSQVSLGNKIAEYMGVVGREKIVDSVLNFFAKGASDALDLCGVKNFIQTSVNPTYKTITAFDSQRFCDIYRDFDKAINNGYDVDHGYISTRYTPGKIENFINNAMTTAFSHIPIVGNINLGAPNIGDYVHVARFVTVDSLGYYRMTELTYNYGTFKDPGGNYHEGATFADLKVYRSELPGDSNAWSDYIVEKHERVPLL